MLGMAGVGAAQCNFRNTAFKPGEFLSYNLYFNWKFVWVKVGTASMYVVQSKYNGQNAYRASLTTKGNSKMDKIFVMRDTLLCYSTLDLAPLYYRKGALEGKRYTVDEVWYKYPGGNCQVTQSRLHKDGHRDRRTVNPGECVYDMMNIFLRARSFDPANWKKGYVVNFRIADGMPLWELRKAVTALPDIEIKTAGMSDMQLRSVLGIQEPHLEGVFAPETYSFRTGLTDIDVYRAAYREQMRILNDEWEKKSPLAAVKTKYEALILASIIEKETSMRADRALVSSVFNNRLRLRMPLQTDPTIIYGIGESFDGNLKRRDLQQPGPYNTYLNAGLPPTPISMPSAASIHAALNPQDTKFLYFVARGDGTTHFSKTLTEHNRAVEKYQKAPARKARALQKRQKDAR